MIFSYVTNKYYSTLQKNHIGIEREKRDIDKTQNKVHILTRILEDIVVESISKNKSLEEKQVAIENAVLNQFEEYLNKYKGYSIAGINTGALTRKIREYLIDHEEDLLKLIENMKKYINTTPSKKLETKLTNIKEIISIVDDSFLLNLCLLHFLMIVTYQDSEDDKKTKDINVFIEMGNKVMRKYALTLKNKDENYKGMKYKLWIADMSKNKPEIVQKLNDTNCMRDIGSTLVDLLIKSGMIVNKVMGVYKDQYSSLRATENFSTNQQRTIVDFSVKLPMIVEPKPFNSEDLGGYLLNGVSYVEELIIHKETVKENSIVEDKNIIYQMVNDISRVPFKINIDLLEFITKNNKHNLLMDTNMLPPYADMEKRTKYQESKYRSHLSKFILQENILAIVQFLKDYPKFYFPIKMDTRGRIYCNTTYFNYQSSELAKALLLFAEPGIINKKNLDDVKYLEYYGVNTFGKSKISEFQKKKWIKDNLEDILDYKNCKLLDKASDKFLFLAFCIEYSRYIKFINDEQETEFKTFLPIQLDATCNGFQHLAMLSNENTLFQELNLVNHKNSTPNDFYSFLVHKLNLMFENKIKEGTSLDKDDLVRYKRLLDFVLERSNIKKAIMTIPYNASHQNMVKYITSSLFLVEEETKDKDVWYSKTSKEEGLSPLISLKDISLLVSSIMFIIHNDFEKIKKLMKYLRNVATILTMLNLPVIWTLPHGLTVKQSYLEVKSVALRPYMYSKVKINMQVVNKNKLNKNHQVRALMPNLIHSLDATSLSLLNNKFNMLYLKENKKLPQFLSVHDCFGTTLDKVDTLKTLLTSVYMEIYSETSYLEIFDKNLIAFIYETNKEVINKETREVTIGDKTYKLHDIEWVVNRKKVNQALIKKIDAQYILI